LLFSAVLEEFPVLEAMAPDLLFRGEGETRAAAALQTLYLSDELGRDRSARR
jgi:hypothetical protein